MEVAQQIPMEPVKTDHYCEKCDKYFRDRPKLTRHNKSIHENVTYDCHLCEAKYRRPEILKSHIRGIHEKADDMKCHICGMSFGLKRHLRVHIEGIHQELRKFKCKICDATFKQVGALHNHLRYRHGERKTCSECDRTFKTVVARMKHQQIVHNMIPTEPTIKNRRKRDRSANELPRMKKRLNPDEIARAKEREEKKATQPPAPKKPSPEPEPDLPFKCDQCTKSYDNPHKLKRHSIRAHGREGDQFPCEKCGELFKLKSTLWRHVRNYHRDYEELQCETCKIWFQSRDSLLNHVRNEHGAKDFMCSVCGDCFAHNQQLKRHYKDRHNMEPPPDVAEDKREKDSYRQEDDPVPVADGVFLCVICDKTYPDKQLYRRHMKDSHWEKEKKQKKRLQCPDCDMSFKHQATLSNHNIRVHCKSDEQFLHMIEKPRKKEGKILEQIAEKFPSQNVITHEGGSSDDEADNEKKQELLEEAKKSTKRSRASMKLPKRSAKRKKNNLKDESDSDMDDDILIPEVHHDLAYYEDIIDAIDFGGGNHNIDDVEESTDIKFLICWTCGKAITKIGCFVRNALAKVEKAYQCLDCDKCFGIDGLMETHVESVMLTRIHVCPTCCKCFNSASLLRKHQNVHENENAKKVNPKKTTTVIWNKIAQEIVTTNDIEPPSTVCDKVNDIVCDDVKDVKEEDIPLGEETSYKKEELDFPVNIPLSKPEVKVESDHEDENYLPEAASELIRSWLI